MIAKLMDESARDSFDHFDQHFPLVSDSLAFQLLGVGTPERK
jgi:hypothetical protein